MAKKKDDKLDCIPESTNADKIYYMFSSLTMHKSPVDWMSRLFDLQNALISVGYIAYMEDESSKELAADFDVMKNFFESLETNKKIILEI